MTRSEVIKELLKSNLDEFNSELNTELSIKFKDDDVIVLYKNAEIFKGSVLDYGLGSFKQSKFILDIGNKLFSFFKEVSEMENYDLIYVNNFSNYRKIIGKSEIIFKKYGVKIDKEKLKNTRKINNDEDYKNFLEKIFSKIRNNLDENRLIVANEEMKYGNYLHVYVGIYEYFLSINCVDDFKLFKKGNKLNSINPLIEKHQLHVFCSEADETEAEQAVKHIEGLIYG